MSLEAQMNHLTAEIVELRSVVNALTVAIEGLTRQAAEEVEAKRAPFIEVIKPSDPRYALGIKAFHQDSIFEPRLEVFADLQSSSNPPQNQGAIAQIIPDLEPQPTKTNNKTPKLTPKSGKRRKGRPKGIKEQHPRAVCRSSCCGASGRQMSHLDGKCFSCR